ncbi:MAG TPA: acyl-CoA ligase (AMP-forming), exosortase A system-associated [Jatrophihabitans sp.]|nr:acyl-CoA ligase (AMP-forming), exosortase A system-associated [Jatrophihabitans sp.]
MTAVVQPVAFRAEPARPHSAPLTRLDDLVWLGEPDRPALTYQDETLSYRELGQLVCAAAAGLRRLGVGRGDRVLVCLEKRLETAVAMLAVSAAGGVLVPVNSAFKPGQVAYVAADCAARVLITSVERSRSLLADLAGVRSLEQLVLIGGASAGDLAAANQAAPEMSVTGWRQLVGPAALRWRQPLPTEPVIDADIAAIFYTSGSTGGPKGVVLSHRNLLAGAQSVAGYLGQTAEDVVLGVLPLSFDAGFSQLTTALYSGAHLVLVNYLLPREVVRLCARHRVTALTCVPPLWLQLAAQDWPAEAARQLRYFANTGGRMPRATLDRLRTIFPAAKPFLMYGLTEAFRSTYLDPAEVDQRPDSIGKAIPNAEVLVLRPDGTPCESGEHGELVHRGALVARGYWNDPDRTRIRFRPFPPGAGDEAPERAVWSGDLVYRDADGFLYFVGRNDDMIKTSGYRVSPTEIEEIAYASGLVGEAAAFGVPDEKLGEHIVLAVSGLAGADCDTELLTRTISSELAKYMVPRRIVVLPELPRSPNGKFDRGELRRLIGA